MSGRGSEEMAIITSAVNAQGDIDMFNTFLVQSIENRLGDNEVIFQDDNASWYRAQSVYGKVY